MADWLGEFDWAFVWDAVDEAERRASAEGLEYPLRVTVTTGPLRITYTVAEGGMDANRKRPGLTPPVDILIEEIASGRSYPACIEAAPVQ